MRGLRNLGEGQGDRDHREQDTEEAWEQEHRGGEVGQGAVAAATDTVWNLILVSWS